MTILVITTGGTIGALPYPDVAHPTRIITMPEAGKDYVREYLEKNVTSIAYRCVSAELIDSNNITDSYLTYLVALMKQNSQHKTLITLGTDGMLRSAEFFYHCQKNDPYFADKTIVLTGAMAPLACGVDSEGPQNLEFSLRYLERPDIMPSVAIVLCDYENAESESGAWKPRLYPYQPGLYEKYYHMPDQRYNRLRKIKKS